YARIPTTAADTIAITSPHKIDVHQRAVPRPMERRGKCSPRRITTSKATALIQISVSFKIADAKVISGVKKTNPWRITTIANSERNSPTHVAREIFATEGRFVLRE